MMKLRGLVFREFYLCRKNIIMTLLIWLMFVIIGILMRLSILYGNMAKMPADELANSASALYNIFTYLPILILMTVNVWFEKNIFSDYNTKWSLFSRTTPVSEYKYVGVKFLLITVMSFVSFALSLTNTAILCRLNSKAFDSRIISNVLYIVLILYIIFLGSCFLSYKLRIEKTCGIIKAVIISVLYLSCCGVIYYLMFRFNQKHPGLSDEESTKIFNDYLGSFYDKVYGIVSAAGPLIITIFIALAVLLYFLSVKAMKRRES